MKHGASPSSKEGRHEWSGKKPSSPAYPNYEQIKSSLLSTFKHKPSLISDDFTNTKSLADILKAKDDLVESLQRQLEARTGQYLVILL